MKRLLQHQRKQNIMMFLLMCKREAEGEESDSRKMQIEELKSKNSEMTLSLKGGVILKGGIWAH